jgi:hypothetical protein
MHRLLTVVALVAVTAAPVFGQTPQPFPRANAPQQPNPAPAQPAPAPAQSQAAQPTATADPNVPPDRMVGFPVFPGAQFLADYEAGKGQRYYLYGTLASYAEVVKHYQSMMRDRGTQVYAEPATHTFAERFREETMAFPPGVTVKDWTSGGSKGYPNGKLGAEPARFPTVIMIVPPPPDAGTAAR